MWVKTADVEVMAGCADGASAIAAIQKDELTDRFAFCAPARTERCAGDDNLIN
jgi:hypothetical protein